MMPRAPKLCVWTPFNADKEVLRQIYKKNICFLASCFHLIASKLHFNALSSRIVRGMEISIFEIHQPKPIMGSVHAPKPTHLWKEGGLRNPQR